MLGLVTNDLELTNPTTTAAPRASRRSYGGFDGGEWASVLRIVEAQIPVGGK